MVPINLIHMAIIKQLEFLSENLPCINNGAIQQPSAVLLSS